MSYNISDSKNTLFSIGQFAALHEINKKTLMWYDEIGLFKPAVVRENGYRYYTYHQSAVLEMILMLRNRNVSVREIQDFMKNRSAEGLKALLEEKIACLDTELAQLKGIRGKLKRQVAAMEELLHLDVAEITVVERPVQYLATVPISKDISTEKEIELMMAEARRQQIAPLGDAVYGSVIAVTSLHAGNFEDYLALFMIVPSPTEPDRLHRRPEGLYLRAFCKGNWDGLPSRYRKILSWAEENGYELTGCAYETGMNEIVAASMEEYITQIEIPVKSR